MVNKVIQQREERTADPTIVVHTAFAAYCWRQRHKNIKMLSTLWGLQCSKLLLLL